MNIKRILSAALGLLLIFRVEAQTFSLTKNNFSAPGFTLSKTDYYDRVHAIWAGQIIATMLALPAEHRVATVKYIDSLAARMVNLFSLDDDWYYEMIAVKGFEKFGTGMTAAQLGDMWKEHQCGSWGSSFAARTNLEKGIAAPLSGHPLYNRFWFTIGPQFSADVYGALAPGMPNVAAAMARTYGHVNGYAEGVDGAVFVATAISLGFTEKDTKTIVRKAASVLSKQSPYRQCIDMVIALAESGHTAQQVLTAVEDRYHIEYPVTNNAVANGGIVAACLWFGEADYLKTVNLAARSLDFTDADCNAANAAGVVMAMKGTAAIPKAMMKALGNRIHGTKMGPVVFNIPVDESISALADRTAVIGEQLLLQHGATLSGNTWHIPAKAIVPQPAELFALADYAKTWNPKWTLTGAGFAGPKGGTYLDLDSGVLVTYPRDEVRRLHLSHVVKVSGEKELRLRVGAEPGKLWELIVFIDDEKVLTTKIESGTDKWQSVVVPMTAYQGRTVKIRLYQNVIVDGAGKPAGNALWQKITLQ